MCAEIVYHHFCGLTAREHNKSVRVAVPSAPRPAPTARENTTRVCVSVPRVPHARLPNSPGVRCFFRLIRMLMIESENPRKKTSFQRPDENSGKMCYQVPVCFP